MNARKEALSMLRSTKKTYYNFFNINDYMIDELSILVERREFITMDTVLNIAKKYKNQ
jgi:hypothetical protein